MSDLDGFWMEVMIAANQVEVNHERTITVARNGREAVVSYSANSNCAVITIRHTDTHTNEPLTAP